MKYCAVLFFTTICCAADYTTGQAARVIIGQLQVTAAVPGASDTLLGGVGGLAYANNMLFVTDANRIAATPINPRVLIYQNLSNQVPPPTTQYSWDGTSTCQICVGRANVVLGQPDFTTTDLNVTSSGFRLPLAVATDGKILVIADTDNNRVLIWKQIPTSNNAPADVVVGQADFTSVHQPIVVDGKSLRGPQGVWIQGTRLYVADTQNNRVLIWNTIPTSNNAPADLVLGVPNFTTVPQQDLTKQDLNVHANSLLNPVSVTSDGTHLFVADLGHNRVLVWNSLPAQNQQPADLVLGQPDTESADPNNSAKMCPSNGKDSNNNPTYPDRCAATMSFPRYALSDGTRLYVADGGNDRVQIWNTIPTSSGTPADVILGQPDENSDVINDNNTSTFSPNLKLTSADTIRTPISLAWDGTNLYVTDPFDRRVMVFTPANAVVPINGIRNGASQSVYAIGSVSFGGSITANDSVTITIQGTAYKYTITKDDTVPTVIDRLAGLINAGPDPNVLAISNSAFNNLTLTSRLPDEAGNNITLAVTVSTNGTITATASGANLSGGRSASTIAPGTIVSIKGTNLADETVAAPANANPLPTELGGVQVYFNGIPAPLVSVSPTEIDAQMPFEISDTNSVSAYVRIRHKDGTVSVTNAVNVPIVLQSPGIFAQPGSDPRVALAFHGSSYATATISVDGGASTGNTATITIDDRQYTYTVQTNDSLASIRDGLIALINANPEERVVASPAPAFTRIVLQAKVPGPEGDDIGISISSSSGAAVILTPSGGNLCCANKAGSPITVDNPAFPGETIIIFATGLGLVNSFGNPQQVATGAAYSGPQTTATVDVSSTAGGATAFVIGAGLKPGAVGIYQVVLQLGADLPTNALTQMTIAQDIYVSNIVTFPVSGPAPPFQH